MNESDHRIDKLSNFIRRRARAAGDERELSDWDCIKIYQEYIHTDVGRLSQFAWVGEQRENAFRLTMKCWTQRQRDCLRLLPLVLRKYPFVSGHGPKRPYLSRGLAGHQRRAHAVGAK